MTLRPTVALNIAQIKFKLECSTSVKGQVDKYYHILWIGNFLCLHVTTKSILPVSRFPDENAIPYVLGRQQFATNCTSNFHSARHQPPHGIQGQHGMGCLLTSQHITGSWNWTQDLWISSYVHMHSQKEVMKLDHSFTLEQNPHIKYSNKGSAKITSTSHYFWFSIKRISF